MKSCYVLLASRPWLYSMASELEKLTGFKFYSVANPQELKKLDLDKLKPRYIFAPHWSWIIPETLWGKHETVIFHMTDLPFGRGGSPLQNLIAREIAETKITALRCEAEVDAGAVYMKESLSLEGSAQEIFERAAPIMQSMLLKIIENEPQPLPQQGHPTFFARRTPAESDISDLNDISKIYDFIRMLDAEGYPHAFLEHNAMRLEFTNARIEGGKLKAQVNISLKGEDNG